MKLFSASYVVWIGLVGTIAAPLLHADAWDHRTEVTFSQPVEIPRVVLSPGTYVIKLVDTSTNRNVVQFLNKRENHVFATVFAIPDYEPNLAVDHSIFTFEERAAGSPQALKTWFYPGDNWGEEFVYPKAEKIAVTPPPTSLTPRPAPEPPRAEAQPTPASAPVVAQNVAPTQPAPVEVAQATPAPAPTPANQLPKTASPLPLIALVGAFCLASGAALRAFAKSY